MVNRQIGFTQDMRERKTRGVFWSAPIVVFSLVMWCPQSFAGGWRTGSEFELDAFFTHPSVTQVWAHDGQPTGVAGEDSNWCLGINDCCIRVGGVPWSSGEFDANIGRVTGLNETAIIIHGGSSREIHLWATLINASPPPDDIRTMVGKAVDGTGTPVGGFTFAELGNIDGDQNTDLFCLVGSTDVGWYEFNPATNNFEVVDVFTGADYRHGTVGYLNDSATNHCLISFGAGVQLFQENPGVPGSLIDAGSLANLADLASSENTTWNVLSLGNVDYDDMPDLLLLGANGTIYWTEWDGVSDFTLQSTHSDPNGGV